MRYTESIRTEIKSSTSIISFQTTGGGSWKVWDRFLTIDGKKAFHIGNICGTCNFFFERMDGANQKVSSKVTIEKLATSDVRIGSEVYYEIEKLMPVGRYLVINSQINPKFVKIGSQSDYFQNEEQGTWGVDGFWGLPHYPRINYYREEGHAIDDRKMLYCFYIPIVPENWLDDTVVADYEKKYQDGTVPTAVAISHLDTKEPADWEEGKKYTQHLCFANYVLDGHHKIYAAAKMGKPLNIISFLSIENSISTEEDFRIFESELKKST